MRSLSLYLHIPFCRSKCPYCDFYSVSEAGTALATYPDLLIAHLEQAACDDRWQGPLSTIFFGGGTPSLLSPQVVANILDTAARSFGVLPEAEISLEANPGTVTLESLAGYRLAGVNRLSLGIQSLNDRMLKKLGRSHRAAQARDAVALARRAGFDNLALDLMFALPGQSRSDLLHELEAYLVLAPEHISCYGLTVEEDTPFHHLHRSGQLHLPDEDRYAEDFLLIHQRLREAGYDHYEISNYARPDHECQHNLRYWRRKRYLGIGAGAHSFDSSDWGKRLWVPNDLDLYQNVLAAGESPEQAVEEFDREGAMRETLYLGLRMAEGVDDTAFRRCFGPGVAEAFPEAVSKCGARLQHAGGTWRLPPENWLLFNHLIQAFL